MEEFHCSREVATIGLSTFVLGLAFGPMLLGPLSEVLISYSCAGLFLTVTVLRAKTNLHCLNGPLRHLADSLCCCPEHTNHDNWEVLGRFRW